MTTPLQSIVEAGTKLWLDSVDPDLIESNRQWGATGATSNPIIIGDLAKSPRYEDDLRELLGREESDATVAWALTDKIVSAAQQTFLPVWEATSGNDGYVSFELDPLLEGEDSRLSVAERTEQYIRLGVRWSEGHKNRLIKTPATPAGLAALEELAAQGVPLNVTLIFTQRQYEAARDAIWRGAQRSASLERFKSVYSIFISRVDVYTHNHLPHLSEQAQGQVGLLGAKQVWQANEAFWADRPTPLEQEIVFASTGAKLPGDSPWKYIEQLVGSGIQTNPPAMNEAVAASGKQFTRTIDQMPPQEVIDEIQTSVDFTDLEATLMSEGVEKFAAPQFALLERIGELRARFQQQA